MSHLLLKSVRRFPQDDQQSTELLINSGKVEGWYRSGQAPREDVDCEIDLEDRWLAPTFVDSHLHLLYTEQHAQQISVAGMGVAECLAALSNFDRTGDSVVGHGWRDPLPKEMLPNPRRCLDKLFPDKSVLLWNADFHRVLVNSKIMNALGKVEDHDGVLVEEEAEAAWNLVKTNPFDEVPGACRRLLNCGISAATTFDRGESISAFRDNSPGRYGVIVRHGMAEEEFLESLDDGGAIPLGNRDDDFAIRWVKIFVDGTLGSRTAWLKQDYDDDPGNRGVVRRCGDSLAETAQAAGERGWGLALHAIGDAAVQEAIRAINVARSARPKNVIASDRIEHLQLLDPADMSSLIQSKAYASLQPCHLYEDRNIVRQRWGDRAAHAIPYRELLDSGVPVLTGTDAPIEPLDPWADIQAACQRRSRNGSGHIEGPHQRVGFLESFHAKTRDAAEANCLPLDYGSLNSGSRADFQILEKPPEEISNISDAGLVQVYTDGNWRL